MTGSAGNEVFFPIGPIIGAIINFLAVAVVVYFVFVFPMNTAEGARRGEGGHRRGGSIDAPERAGAPDPDPRPAGRARRLPPASRSARSSGAHSPTLRPGLSAETRRPADGSRRRGARLVAGSGRSRPSLRPALSPTPSGPPTGLGLAARFGRGQPRPGFRDTPATLAAAVRPGHRRPPAPSPAFRRNPAARPRVSVQGLVSGPDAAHHRSLSEERSDETKRRKPISTTHTPQ